MIAASIVASTVVPTLETPAEYLLNFFRLKRKEPLIIVALFVNSLLNFTPNGGGEAKAANRQGARRSSSEFKIELAALVNAVESK